MLVTSVCFLTTFISEKTNSGLPTIFKCKDPAPSLKTSSKNWEIVTHVPGLARQSSHITILIPVRCGIAHGQTREFSGIFQFQLPSVSPQTHVS